MPCSGLDDFRLSFFSFHASFCRIGGLYVLDYLLPIYLIIIKGEEVEVGGFGEGA